MTHSPRRRPTASAAAVAALGLLAGACGASDDSTDEAIIVTVADDSGAGAGADAGEGIEVADEPISAGTDEERALAFAACMRDEGIDFPDPVVAADGSVDFLGANRDRDRDGFAQDPGFRGAVDTCSELIEGASFLPTDDDLTEREDAFLEAAECLRDNGVDVPDPQLGAGTGPFGADFDPDDPATAAAIEACQDVFTSIGDARQGGS